MPSLGAQLDLRTGNFNLAPRYSREGCDIGLGAVPRRSCSKGRDFPRITQTVARIGTLAIANIGFGLSREQQAKTETEAQAVAIGNFKQRADELAKNFGFSGYTLREGVGQRPSGRSWCSAAHDGHGGAMAKASGPDAPVPDRGRQGQRRGQRLGPGAACAPAPGRVRAGSLRGPAAVHGPGAGRAR